MTSDDPGSTADDYVDAAGRYTEGRYSLSFDELSWLVDHGGRLGAIRLDLLRALQATLSASLENEDVEEVKELLTDLIIMQTRLAKRGEGLQELLSRLGSGGHVTNVPIDVSELRSVAWDILRASRHVHQAAEGERGDD